MKYILKYLKKYRIRAILAPLFKMLEASFELMVPLVMRKLIDVGIANGDKNYVIKMGMVLIMLTVVGYLASITAQYFSARAAMGVGKQLRGELFRHISSLSYNEIDSLGSSTLITRMSSDVNQVITGVNMFLRLFLRSPFIVIGAVVMAFTVDVHTSIVFAVVLPFLVAVVFFITFSSIPKYKKVQKALDKVTLLTRESLIGVRVIRAFNRQEVEEKEFHQAADDLKTAQIRVGRLSSFMKKDSHAGDKGFYSIRSLYFDDHFDSFLDENISGVDEREKWRIRIYDRSSSFISLERKIIHCSSIIKSTLMLKIEIRENFFCVLLAFF